MTNRNVDLIRLQQEEELFDKEEVLGRDVSSVFPSQSKSKRLNQDEVDEILPQARQFITEKEVINLKEKVGQRFEDGTLGVDKPLAQVLQDQKDQKQLKFDNMWKQMKQGKHRPLDDDEIQFMEELQRQQEEQEEYKEQQERQQMEIYRLKQLQQQMDATSHLQQPQSTNKEKPFHNQQKKPQVKINKIKVKHKQPEARHGQGSKTTNLDSAYEEASQKLTSLDSGQSLEPQSKKAKFQSASQQLDRDHDRVDQNKEQEKLTGLFNYGSDTSSP